MRENILKVLLIEDNPGDARLVREMLAETTYVQSELTCCDTLSTGLEHLTNKGVDIVLLDLELPDSSGTETFTKVYDQVPDLPIIVMTGHDDEENTVQALREGAQDYLVKGQIEANLLGRAIRYACDRKWADQVLRKSEEKHRRLIENLGREYFFYVHNTDGVFIYVSPSVTEMLGYGVDEFKTHVSKYLTDTQANKEVAEKIAASVNGVKQPPYQVEIFHKSGEKRWLEVTESPIFCGEGKVESVEGIAHDITLSKQADETIIESKAFLDSLMDAIPIPIFYKDTNGHYLGFNNAFEIFFATTKENLVGKTTFDINPPDLAKVYNEKDLVLIKNGGVQRYESQVKNFCGELRNVIFDKAVFTDSKGIVCGLIGTIIDITEQKDIEQKLQKNANELNSLFKSMINAFVLFDSVFDERGTFVSYRFVYINDAYERITGVKKEEVRGKTVHEVWPGTEQSWIEKYGAAAVTGITQTFEMFHEPTQKLYYCNAYRPWETRDRFCVIFEDITERKQMQEQLQQAHKMEAIGTLAGGIAHDFNNILGVIMGSVELSLEDLLDSTETHQTLSLALNASRRAKDLVKQILAFSRQTEQEKKLIHAVSIVKEACIFLRSSLPATIEILESFTLDSDLIFADPTQFHQVLMNLCTNASHAMKNEGGKLDVGLDEITLERDDLDKYPYLKIGSYLRLTISDTGYGIKKENLDRIFDPYYTTKKVGEGTGLGLSVVHGIVKSHGGTINVCSEIEKGTTFHVLIPLAVNNQKTEKLQTGTDLSIGTETILFVDDEEYLVKIAKKIIERKGYKVVALRSPEEALATFRGAKDRFDLIITDKTMPHMTGFDLARQIKSICSDIPIIMCTGFKDETDSARAREVGIQEFIMKPLDKRQMFETIQRVLEQK